MPARIAALPRDRRGYPIPFVVMRDGRGDPHFTMNDLQLVARAASDGLCSICGEKLGAWKAMAGGPASAFHPEGAYFDGPLHRECGEYALRVCPWLATPGWSKRIGARTLRPGAVPDGAMLVAEDVTVHPDQPPVFVLITTKRVDGIDARHYRPRRPYGAVSYWRGGEQLGAAEARRLIEAGWTGACPIEDLVWPTKAEERT
jgi:hypothetical protein